MKCASQKKKKKQEILPNQNKTNEEIIKIQKTKRRENL